MACIYEVAKWKIIHAMAQLATQTVGAGQFKVMFPYLEVVPP